MIAKDREIVKVILLLTGSIQGAKNIVNGFLQSFDKFSWLWKEKIKTKLDKFSSKNPSNTDYEDELKKFVKIESGVNGLIDDFKIGAMSLKMNKIQSDLTAWCKQWKNSYSDSLHSRAFKSLEHLTEKTK
jgi:dynein heavy chain